MVDLKDKAQALNPQLVEWRRHVHQNPEIGFDTPETEAFIVEKLREMGIQDIQTGVAGHGVTAIIKGDKPGKVLGMRADIDALNMKEDSGQPFASKNDYMHACGHDAHVSMMLGAVRLIMDNKKDLSGTIKLIFQPSEETGTGAPAMIEEGVLENPALDGIVGLHTGNLWKGPMEGQIGYRYGAIMASADWFYVTFTGKGGHGATPHLTIDPVAMACQAVTALQMIVSRKTSPLSSAVVTVGTINGGTAPNIIAPTCTISGTTRSLDPETRTMLLEQISHICENVAQALGGTVEVKFVYGPPPLMNERIMTEKLIRAAGDVLGEENVVEVVEPTMGGEDMAFFQEKVPGTFFFHPSGFGEGKTNPHHHPKFDVNEDVLWVGSAVLANFALTWQNEE